MLDASVDLHVQTQLTGFVRSLHSNLCPKLECAFMAFLIPASPDQTSYSRFSGVRLGELPYEDVVVSSAHCFACHSLCCSLLIVFSLTHCLPHCYLSLIVCL